MPKKTNSSVKPDQMLADATRISPQQIWQAGLGAFIKAQQEGDRAFSRLVQEGSELQKRERAEARAGDEADQPSSWQRLEEMFEDRVARALAAMDIPTHRDLQELRDRVEELTRLLGRSGRGADEPAPTARKAAAKKPPATKATKAAAQPAARAVARTAAKKAMVKKPAAKRTT